MQARPSRVSSGSSNTALDLSRPLCPSACNAAMATRLSSTSGAAQASAVDLARDVPDAFERSMVQLAEQLLPLLLSDGEKESSMVLAEGRKEGLSERTIYRASKSLGVEIHRRRRRREHKSYWALPGVTPEPVVSPEEGVAGTVGGSASQGESNP